MKREAMTKAEKKEKKSQRKLNRRALRHGGVATLITAVFIVVVVLINVLVTAVSNRFNTTIDMTSSQDFSITTDNRAFIEQIDKEVTITVALTEEQYTGSGSDSYYYYLYQNSIQDSTGGKYLTQAAEILKNYSKINPKIKVQFEDPYSPSFDPYVEKYSGESLALGDYIVECTFTNSNGESQTRHKILGVDDLFDVQDETGYASSGYGSYTIANSKVESAVTSALYYVTAEQTDRVTVITGYGCDSVEAMQSAMVTENYEFNTIETLLTDTIPEDTNILVLAAPTKDMTPEETKIIDKWLTGDEAKNLVYFASGSQTVLPNIEDMLSNWGIEFETGMLYETDDSQHSSESNTLMILADNGTEYTKEISSYSQYYFCDSIRPMKTTFEERGKYYTKSIIKSNASTVVQPRGAAKNWKPEDGAQAQAYDFMAISTYAKDKPSNVLAIASVDFVSDTYMSNAYVVNQQAVEYTINTMVLRDTDMYDFTAKTIDTAQFTSSELQQRISFWACVVGVPVLTILIGVVIVVRRKCK